MCGIAGSFGKIDIMQRRILTLLNQTRGADSVGMMSDFRVCRIPVSAMEAIKKDRIPDWAWKGDIWAVHTRASSPNMGGISKETTHPFTYGKWTVAHNGFIRNWREVIKDHEEKHPACKTFKVDSNVIPLVLEEHGFEGLKLLSGCAATWMYNIDEKDCVYLWVNDQSLSLYESKDAIVWSSDDDHLKLAGFPKKNTIVLKDTGQLIKVSQKDMTANAIGYFEGKKWEYPQPQQYKARVWRNGEYVEWDDDNPVGFNHGVQYSGINRAVTPVRQTEFSDFKWGDFQKIRLKDIPSKFFGEMMTTITKMNYEYLHVCNECNEIIIDCNFKDHKYLGLTCDTCPVCKKKTDKCYDKDITKHHLAYEVKARINRGALDEKLNCTEKQLVIVPADTPPAKEATEVTSRDKIIIIDGTVIDIDEPEEKVYAVVNMIENPTEFKSICWCPHCADFILPQEFPGGFYETTPGGFINCPNATCGKSITQIPTTEHTALNKLLNIYCDININRKTYGDCEACGGSGVEYDSDHDYKETLCPKCHGSGSIVQQSEDKE